jgi:hypothetical protein
MKMTIPRSQIPHWLRQQGYTKRVRMEGNCVFVRTSGDANDVTTILNQNWIFDTPQPEVGYDYDEEEDDED